MKDQLIKAINIYSERHPDYQISYIAIWSSNDTSVIFRIIGIKGHSEISDMIKVDL